MKFKKILKSVLFFTTVVSLLCLVGCGTIQSPQVPTVSQATESLPQVESYKVVFRLNDLAIKSQIVEEGKYPVAPELPEGYWIEGWKDPAGAITDPATVPIREDTVFFAKAYPDLSLHEPYLFTDESGAIRGDEKLSAKELSDALAAVAVSKTALSMVVIPQSDVVPADQLYQVLTDCFPSKQVDRAFADIPESDTDVTRAQFAQIFNQLLGRQGEAVALKIDQILSAEVLPLLENADLLEAALAHSPKENGVSITEAVLSSRWAPGFHLYDGWLYYADENGSLLRNGQLDSLTFGADGRYTCADKELDATVASILREIAAEHADADREELLYQAFLYVRDNFSYLRRDLKAVGATGWMVEDAKAMFEKSRGNCYSFAAAFCALARGLGYDAHCISGLVLQYADKHGWVEIEFDGNTYIFDPQLANKEMNGGRSNFGEDMFMIPKERWSWFLYIRP